MSDKELLLFTDVETTGLDANYDLLLEVAGIITDLNGKEVSEGFSYIIRHDGDRAFATANRYVQEMHAKTGLWGRLEYGDDIELIDNWVHDYITSYAPGPKSIRMAGNSIRLDLNFLEVHLPRTYSHLHYRSVDCTAIEYALMSWGVIDSSYPKVGNHTAVGDVMESVEQYRWLRRSALDYDPLRHLDTSRFPI